MLHIIIIIFISIIINGIYFHCIYWICRSNHDGGVALYLCEYRVCRFFLERLTFVINNQGNITLGYMLGYHHLDRILPSSFNEKQYFANYIIYTHYIFTKTPFVIIFVFDVLHEYAFSTTFQTTPCPSGTTLFFSELI